jgi:kynureninase
LITPENKNERGSHISIKHEEAWRISQCLIYPANQNSKEIIVDYRPNNIIRIALTPLYTSFEDIYYFCFRVIEIIKKAEFEKKNNTKEGVT